MPQPPVARGVWGRSEFLRLSHIKNSFQHTFLSKKDIPIPAVSAVTTIVSDNTKIF